jgi:mycothiol synthase
MVTDTTERHRTTLPPLTWRNLRGPADYRVLADMARRCNLADHVDEVLTVDAIANEMEHPVNFDPAVDVLIAEIEGRPVAWQQTLWRLEDEHYIYRLKGFVSPGWRRRGIGRELLRRGERRLRKVATGHPVDAERFFVTFCPAKREGKLALFKSEGYRPVRHFFTMLHSGLDDLPDALLPAGLELRSVRPQDWRAIWDANDEAFRDHWGYTPMTDNDFKRWQNGSDFDPSLCRVAWDTASNQVAGVTINTIPSAANAAHSRRRGVVDNLSVRRPWRKRGLGRGLLVASLHAMRDRGQTEVELGVDSENISGALRLYESVGFRQIDHGISFRKPME